jgi:hypothetical protein
MDLHHHSHQTARSMGQAPPNKEDRGQEEPKVSHSPSMDHWRTFIKLLLCFALKSQSNQYFWVKVPFKYVAPEPMIKQ